MTDNIITKDEAIDRMKAGLPCETWNKYLGGGEWRKTEWDDFTDAHKFRRPPERRRVAERMGTKTAIAEQRPACCEQGLNYPGGVCPRCHELFGSIPP